MQSEGIPMNGTRHKCRICGIAIDLKKTGGGRNYYCKKCSESD